MDRLDAYEIEGHGLYWELYRGQTFLAVFETEAALDAAVSADTELVKHTHAAWEEAELAAAGSESAGAFVVDCHTERRDELEAGDVFQSSHGFRVHVERVIVVGDTATIHGRMHTPDGPEHVEAYPRSSRVELVSEVLR
jgi:hypothetical protein